MRGYEVILPRPISGPSRRATCNMGGVWNACKNGPSCRSIGAEQETRGGGTMTRRWLLLICCLVLAYPARGQQTQTGDEMRRKAVELYKENRMEQALPLLEELTVARPQDAALQEMLGMCLLGHAVNFADPE